MYSIGAFLGGKLMAVYPNEYKYYEELYRYAMDLSKESGVFIEVRYFDSDAYKETMELLKQAVPIDKDMESKVIEDINKRFFNNENYILER